MGAMTLTQRLQILASTQRSRLAELAGLDELTPELRAELDTLGTTHQDTESQLRAAIAADDAATPPGDPVIDSEVRERLELRGRASFGRYLHAALTGAQISGAESEFQAACKVPGIPLDLFEQDRPVEVRADAASGVPATGAGATLAPIQPFVFSQSIADHHRGDAALECRDATGSPGRLVGVILPAGRVAGDRPELFVGSGVQTPADGIALLPEHRSSTVVMRFDPIRGDDGSLRVDHLLPNSPAGRDMAASVRSGAATGLSVEFFPLDEAQVQGVREVRQALVTAVATVPRQSYDQARAEVRERTHHRRVLTWL